MKIKMEKDPTGFRYTSFEDIKIKLNASWVYYDGLPVYVQTGIDDENYFMISIKSIENGSWSRGRKIDVRDPKVNQYEFPMGWYNSKSHKFPVYVARLPTRMYKQGVTRQALQAEYFCDGVLTFLSMYETEIDSWLRQEFPDPESAISEHKIWKDGCGVALSKDVAIIKLKNELRVFVQREDIGKFHPNTMSTEVTKEGMYSVISCYLEEAGIQ